MEPFIRGREGQVNPDKPQGRAGGSIKVENGPALLILFADLFTAEWLLFKVIHCNIVYNNEVLETTHMLLIKDWLH